MLWMQDQERKTKNPRSSGATQSQLSPRSASGGASSPKPSSARPLGTTSPRPLGTPSPRPLGATSPRPLHPTHVSTGSSSPQQHQGCNSSNNTNNVCLPRHQTRAATASPHLVTGHISPKAGCSSHQDTCSESSPKPGSSRGEEASCSNRIPITSASASSSSGGGGTVDHGLGPGFQLRETASYLNGLPTDLLCLDDLDGDSILRRVMLESQQEYLNSLKRGRSTR